MQILLVNFRTHGSYGKCLIGELGTRINLVRQHRSELPNASRPDHHCIPLWRSVHPNAQTATSYLAGHLLYRVGRMGYA